MSTEIRLPLGAEQIYPYHHRCWCGVSWTVTYEGREEHEAEVRTHREEHRTAERRARKGGETEP